MPDFDEGRSGPGGNEAARVRLSQLEDDVSSLVREVGGTTPGGPSRSLRARIHDLESTASAENAARSALSALSAERAAHSSARERRVYATLAIGATIGNVLLAHFIK